MRFLDVPISNAAVLGLGEGKRGKGGAREEVEGGVRVDGPEVVTGLACETTTRSSVRSIVAEVDGPLVDISESEADTSAEASVPE